jgi:hypothetical protein
MNMNAFEKELRELLMTRVNQCNTLIAELREGHVLDTIMFLERLRDISLEQISKKMPGGRLK